MAGEFTFETFVRFSSVFHPFPTVGCVRPAFQNGGGFHFVGPLIYFYGFSQLIGHATSICKFHMIQIRLAKITHRNRWLSIDASGPSPSILQSNVSMFQYSMFAACFTYSPPGLINRNWLIHSSTPSAQRVFRKPKKKQKKKKNWPFPFQSKRKGPIQVDTFPSDAFVFVTWTWIETVMIPFLIVWWNLSNVPSSAGRCSTCNQPGNKSPIDCYQLSIVKIVTD